MNKLTNGTQYRATETGYVLARGARTIVIQAKSVAQGEVARNLIASKSFNVLFNMGKRVGAFNSNERAIFIK